MGRELDGDRFPGCSGQFLFDLGEVPVFRDTVGPDAFIALAEQVVGLGFASGSTDTTH